MNFKEKHYYLSGWTRLAIVMTIAWPLLVTLICEWRAWRTFSKFCGSYGYDSMLCGVAAIWFIYFTSRWIFLGFKYCNNDPIKSELNQSQEAIDINKLQSHKVNVLAEAAEQRRKYSKVSALNYMNKILGNDSMKNQSNEEIIKASENSESITLEKEKNKSNDFTIFSILTLTSLVLSSFTIFSISSSNYWFNIEFIAFWIRLFSLYLIIPTFIWSIIIASRVDSFWSITCMFAYIIVFPVFSIVHWSRAKYAFLALIICTSFYVGGYFLGGLHAFN